jgi:hypothetical protein
MVDGPGAQCRLGPAEEVLDLQQVAVAENGVQRGDPGIGLQHEDPIVARFKPALGPASGRSRGASLPASIAKAGPPGPSPSRTRRR